MGVAGESTWSGDFRELIAADKRPIAGAVEGAEAATDDGRVGQGLGAHLAVICEDDLPLARVEAFAVVAGQCRRDGRWVDFLSLPRLRHILDFLDQAFHGERVDVDLIQAVFHRGEVDLIYWVSQVAGVARVPTRHEFRRDHAHLSIRIDEVGPNDELLRLHVNHSVRGRAADAFRADDLL